MPRTIRKKLKTISVFCWSCYKGKCTFVNVQISIIFLIRYFIRSICRDRTKIAYDYDENDNIIAKYYLDLHNQETDDKIVYSYNGENMRLGMRDKSGLSRTLYDSNGNMIVSTSNNDKDIVKYEYDANNRLIKMIYPNNIVVTYTYDENGNTKTVTDKDGLKTTYTYDDNDNEVIRTTGNIETNKRYDADNRLIRIKNEHRFTGELIDEYSYRYDSNNNIIEEIKREPYKKKVETFDIEPIVESDHTIRVTKQSFTYDAENKLTDARVERLGMKALTEPNVTTYHYEYDQNGNRTLVEIKDDRLTLESTVYEYNRLNQMIRSREVTAKGLYIYEYRYDDNGNLISEDRHRIYETQPVFYTNIRRYEYTKDNKLESVYSGNTLLVAYSYDGDGTITSALDRDLDFNQNLNINDHSYINRLTNNQRRLINKINPSDTILYELTEYVLERNQEYSQVLMERDGAGNLSTIYTYGNQRINSESYPNLSGLYTYDGRGSVSAVIGGYGDFRATYWYDGLGNVKSQVHGYGVFGSGKKYFGYNAESYNPVTGNQNLRARQVNIRRQRFLTEDTFLGVKSRTLSLNRYIYAKDNPLKFKDPDGLWAIIISLNGIINPLVGTEGDIGFAIGYNKYEGVVAKPVFSGGVVFSSHPGVSGGASITLDVRDIPAGSGMTTSYGGSLGTSIAKISIGGDANFDTNTGKFTSLTIGISAGVSFNPMSVEVHGKEIWSYAHYDRDETIKNSYRTWKADGYQIANTSDIPIAIKSATIDEIELDKYKDNDGLIPVPRTLARYTVCEYYENYYSSAYLTIYVVNFVSIIITIKVLFFENTEPNYNLRNVNIGIIFLVFMLLFSIAICIIIIKIMFFIKK